MRFNCFFLFFLCAKLSFSFLHSLPIPRPSESQLRARFPCSLFLPLLIGTWHSRDAAKSRPGQEHVSVQKHDSDRRRCGIKSQLRRLASASCTCSSRNIFCVFLSSSPLFQTSFVHLVFVCFSRFFFWQVFSCSSPWMVVSTACHPVELKPRLAEENGDVLVFSKPIVPKADNPPCMRSSLCY